MPLAVVMLAAACLAVRADPRPVLGAPELPASHAGGAARAAADPDPATTYAMRRDAARRPSDPAPRPASVPPGGPSDGGVVPATVDRVERIERIERTEREVDARRLRGALAPPAPAVPRIGAEPPVEPAPVLIPRIAVPGPGEPGGPPIALPTCGAAGCFDAGGRPLSGGGAVLTTPEGRPCVRIGAAATCP